MPAFLGMLHVKRTTGDRLDVVKEAQVDLGLGLESGEPYCTNKQYFNVYMSTRYDPVFALIFRAF